MVSDCTAVRHGVISFTPATLCPRRRAARMTQTYLRPAPSRASSMSLRKQAMPATRTILLVDDDHEILHAMRALMESKGYRVLTANDGNAGLNVAERERPDLVVVD